MKPLRPTKPIAERGLTLVELLVVISIISILVGLSLAAVQAARQAALSTECKNNVRQLMMGVRQLQDNQGYTALRGNWVMLSLPFIDPALEDALRPGGTEGGGRQLRRPSLFTCRMAPRAETSGGWGNAHYALAFEEEQRWSIVDMPTAVAHQPHGVPRWMDGPRFQLSDLPSRGGPHWGGYNFASSEGHVDYLSR